MRFEVTIELLADFIRLAAYDRLNVEDFNYVHDTEFTTQAEIEAFFERFKQVEEERENEEYWHVIKDTVTGLHYQISFPYYSWEGTCYDDPQNLAVVEYKAVVEMRWVAVNEA